MQAPKMNQFEIKVEAITKANVITVRNDNLTKSSWNDGFCRDPVDKHNDTSGNSSSINISHLRQGKEADLLRHR